MSLTKFLADLREFESGVYLDKYKFYLDNLDVKCVKYPRVKTPGKLQRDAVSGLPIFDDMTISEMFYAQGILSYFDTTNCDCLLNMQYRSINAWGYVGYQIGEHILIENKYYKPRRVQKVIDGKAVVCDSYYRGDVAESTWANGVTEHLHLDESNDRHIVCTDTNEWNGSFTGKNGVNSFEDFVKPKIQNIIIREIMLKNWNLVKFLVKKNGMPIENILSLEWPSQIGNGKLGNSVFSCSVSGILASCHLTGPIATVDLLLNMRNHSDHLGTSALNYLEKFGGYDVSRDFF